jgi:DNA replication protein DnaD
MQTGRTLSTHEAGKLTDAIKVYGIEPDVLDFAIDYCVGIDKGSVDYICKVALRWTEDGGKDVGTVKQMLDRRSKRNDAYRKVFAELGFNRLPNPSDREIMDRWFDEKGCSLQEVLDACKAAGGMREPHLRYVNKVIENRILEKGGVNTRAEQIRKTAVQSQQPVQAAEETAKVSRKVLRDYYEYIRNEEDNAHVGLGKPFHKSILPSLESSSEKRFMTAIERRSKIIITSEIAAPTL